MITVKLEEDKLKLNIDACSHAQREFFKSLIRKIPGYGYIKGEGIYFAPIIELKSVVNILGINAYFLDDKNIVIEKYKAEAKALKDAIRKHNPSNFLPTLNTNKEYPFLKLPLKNFQKLAVEWGSTKKGIAQIYGGLVADEVGLGKTVESISIVSNLIEEGVCDKGIILCPSNMVLQWKEEIERFTYKTCMPILSKYKKEKRLEKFNEFNETFLIMGHELFLKDADDIMELKKKNKNLDFSFIIMDEAHKMKNINSKLYGKVSKIKPQVKLLLTATPAKKDVDDLFALFNYLDPSILMGWTYFKNKFLEFTFKFGREILIGSKPETEPFLHMLIAPYMIRRKSVDVSDEIPDLIEEFIAITPTKEQKRWFTILEKEMEKELLDAEKAFKNNQDKLASFREGMYRSRFMALSGCSDHLGLLDLTESIQTKKLVEKNQIKDYTSPKLDWLIDFIERNLIQNNAFFKEDKDKLVIFTQFEKMTKIIEKEITEKLSKTYPNQINLLKFTGKMDKGCLRMSKENLSIDCFNCSKKDSCNSVEKSKFLFVNDKDVNILLCTDAAQAGINLQVARFLVNFDLPYSPGAIDQRNGRIKRIGSKYSQVLVYNLYVVGGPDVRIVNKLQNRRDSIDEVVESNEDEKEAYCIHMPQ